MVRCRRHEILGDLACNDPLVKHPRTAGFRPKSRYDIFVDRLSEY